MENTKLKLQQVTKEQAVKLAELGYPQRPIINPIEGYVIKDQSGHSTIEAPELELAAKFLREEYGIIIVIDPYSFNISINKIEKYQYHIYYWDNYYEHTCVLPSYEEALSHALSKVLDQLLLERKNPKENN